MSADNQDLEVRKKRAIYRSNYRGTKEMDVIVGKYASEKIPEMNADDLKQMEEFLTIPDRDLEGWIMRKEYSADNEHINIIERIRQFHGLTN